MEREGGEFKGRKTRDVNTRQKHREENGRRPTAARVTKGPKRGGRGQSEFRDKKGRGEEYKKHTRTEKGSGTLPHA